MNRSRQILELYARGGFDWEKILQGDASRFDPLFTAPDRWRSNNPIADQQANYLVDNFKQRKLLDRGKYNDPRHPLMSSTVDTGADPPYIGGMREDADGQAVPASSVSADSQSRHYLRKDSGGEEIAKAQKDSQSRFSKPAPPTFQEDSMADADEVYVVDKHGKEHVMTCVPDTQARAFLQYFRDRGNSIEAGDFNNAINSLVMYILEGVPLSDRAAKTLATQFSEGDLHYMLKTLFNEQTPNPTLYNRVQITLKDIYHQASRSKNESSASPKGGVGEAIAILQRISTLYEGYGGSRPRRGRFSVIQLLSDFANLGQGGGKRALRNAVDSTANAGVRGVHKLTRPRRSYYE